MSSKAAGLPSGDSAVVTPSIVADTTLSPSPGARRLPRRLSLLLLGVLVALLFAACTGTANPQGWAAPVVSGDMVIVGTDDGELSALRLPDYTLIWRYPAENDDNLEAIYSTPVVTADTVYFGDYGSEVYALDKSNGRPRWGEPFKAKDPIIGGLVLDEASDTLFVVSDDGKVYGLDPATGRVKAPWPFEAGDKLWATPLLADGILYVPTLGGKLFALEAATGHPVWGKPFEAEAGLVSRPVLAGKTLLVGGIDRKLYAIEISSGNPVWTQPFEADNWFWAEPVVAGAVIYVGSLDDRLYAVNLQEGTAVWTKPFKGDQPIRSRPLITLDGSAVIFAARSGKVYGLDPASGALKWAAPADVGKSVFADLVLVEGKVLVSASGGGLFTIDPSTGAFVEVVVR